MTTPLQASYRLSMLNAGRILKTISQQSASTTTESAISAFIGWLAYACEPEDLVTPELVNSFFQECLEYPHWQQNKKSLGEELRYFLEAICLHQNEIFEFAEVTWPSQMQIIELENLPNWVDAINAYLTAQYRQQEKFRLIHDESTQKIIAIILYPNGNIHVRQFSRKFFVRSGSLTPLREDLELKYDSDFELQIDANQKVETAPFTTARFRIQDLQLFGSISRGYFFQKYISLNGQMLEDSSKLFYTIRRLEQHFIKRDSDPYYQSCIDSIEHCIRMLKIGDEEYLEKAPDVLSQAQNSLEYVFIGDKLLSLLVRDLQYTMAGRVQTQTPLVTTDKTTAVKQKENNQWKTPNTSSIQAKTKTTNKTIEPTANHIYLRRPRGSDLTN